MTVKVFDCSNSSECAQPRGFGGPRENTCIATVKKYAHDFGVEFVSNVSRADVLFTNDIFPATYLEMSLPKVKRMDGVFWQENLSERNVPYNAAAEQADHVIFISKYSCNQYFRRYAGNIRSFTIVPNWVDEEIFTIRHGKYINHKIEYWVASATDWSREEKRLDTLINFARDLPSSIYLALIGICKMPLKVLPSNIILMRYLSQEEISRTLRNADAFINVSYRDAAPKCVAEAASCGLPILYADSGGVSELVQIGLRVPDYESYFAEENHTPKLYVRPEYIQDFTQNFVSLRDAALEAARQSPTLMLAMIEEYCNAFKKVV